MALHLRTHPVPVPGCFGCKVVGVQLSGAAQGRYEAVKGNAMDARWNKDMDAYKRLRGDGVQPLRIDGSAKVEGTADHLVQVNPRKYAGVT